MILQGFEILTKCHLNHSALSGKKIDFDKEICLDMLPPIGTAHEWQPYPSSGTN